jgi:hypothetical protein
MLSEPEPITKNFYFVSIFFSLNLLKEHPNVTARTPAENFLFMEDKKIKATG